MKSRAYRPRRSLRIEFVQLVAAMALPAAIFYVFPYKALAPVASAAPDGGRRPAACAFVDLAPEQERSIMAAAKSAWQVGAESVRRLRLDMFVEEIPDAPPDPVIDISARTRLLRAAPLPECPSSPPTDLRSAPPEALGAEKDDGGEPAPAFSREEMLRLD